MPERSAATLARWRIYGEAARPQLVKDPLAALTATA